MNISLAALPDVRWSSEAKASIEILSRGPKIESFRECVGKGFSSENKFEIRVCKPRSMWFDKCEDVLVLIKQISKDPISGKLSLLQDTLGDGEDPEERSVVSEINALESLRNSGVVPVQIGDSNLSVRVTETCKGSYSSTVRRISRILSFGVIEFRGDTSGWVEFK